MGKYLKEARHHAEKIRYYYNQGGTKGYSQAEYHYEKLSELILRAEKSKKYKNDAFIIQTIKISAYDLMKEMRNRQKPSMSIEVTPNNLNEQKMVNVLLELLAKEN
jgi:hypothetical protein